MRGRRHLITKCFIAVLAVFLIGLISASAVFAQPDIPEKRIIYLDKAISSSNIMLSGVSKTSAITKLKSSKKSVAAVSKFEYQGTAYVAVAPKKAGTTIVTFNLKYGGKTIKAKTTVVVKKHVNPFKTFKIGSKNYASKFNKTGHVSLARGLKGKLKIKLKAGYMISGMSVYSWRDGSGFKEVKNNKTVTVPSGKTLSVRVSSEKAMYEEPMPLELRIE